MRVPWCCAVTAIDIDCSSEKACSCSVEAKARAAAPEAKNENVYDKLINIGRKDFFNGEEKRRRNSTTTAQHRPISIGSIRSQPYPRATGPATLYVYNWP